MSDVDVPNVPITVEDFIKDYPLLYHLATRKMQPITEEELKESQYDTFMDYYGYWSYVDTPPTEEITMIGRLPNADGS